MCVCMCVYVCVCVCMCICVELVRYLFTIPGVGVFLSNRICQDPLENFFGQQCQRGRANGNPSSSEFVRNTHKHYESYQIHVEPYVEIAGVMLPLILIF